MRVDPGASVDSNERVLAEQVEDQRAYLGPAHVEKMSRVVIREAVETDGSTEPAGIVLRFHEDVRSCAQSIRGAEAGEASADDEDRQIGSCQKSVLHKIEARAIKATHSATKSTQAIPSLQASIIAMAAMPMTIP